MIHKFLSQLYLIGLATLSVAQAPLIMRPTDRIAIAHDGNNWDKDEVFSYALNYALIWAFGMEKQLVHAQINNLLAPNNNPSFYDQMMTSGEGRNLFPGFDPSLQFDCVTNYAGAIADFKAKAEQGSDNSILYFLLNGPMETAWQSINAVAPEKRRYIRCVSNSTWNETYTNSNGLTHTWADIKASFSGDGVVFYDILDQNGNLGGVGTAQWNFLNSMPESSLLPQSTWTWLKGRDWKLNGDASESGSTWFVLTGMDKGRSFDIEARLKNPLPRSEVPTYFLTATANNGTVTLNPAGGAYASGTEVSITVNPNPGYSFSGWSGDISGSANPATITMDANKNILATCASIQQNVEILGAWTEGTSHSQVAGVNRALVVLVYGEHSTKISAKSATYGDQLMTKVAEQMFHTSGNRSYTGAFILNEEKIAAATSNTIAVNWSVMPSSGNAITSVFLSNADQNALVGAFASKGAKAVSTIATKALANNAGDMIIVAGTGEKNGSYSLNNGFTKGIEIAPVAWGDGVVGFKSATGTNETPKLTQSISMQQTILGFVIRKASGLGKFGIETAQAPVSFDPKVLSFDPKMIAFTLPQSQKYSMAIFNMAGVQVFKNVSGFGKMGHNTLIFNQPLSANQTYFIRLQVDKDVFVQKRLLLTK